VSDRRRLTKKQRLAVHHAHGGECHICGSRINLAREDFEVEHVVPLALGGADTFDNWRPAHVGCHAGKTAKDIRKIAKAKRVKAKHDGTYRAPRHIVAGSVASPFKRCINGAVIERATGRIIREAWRK
jgi:5-methylcytosine-specific restriction endonuclease McrA